MFQVAMSTRVRNVCEMLFACRARKRRELEQRRVRDVASKSYLLGGYITRFRFRLRLVLFNNNSLCRKSISRCVLAAEFA